MATVQPESDNKGPGVKNNMSIGTVETHLSNDDISILTNHAKKNVRDFAVLSELSKNLKVSHLGIDEAIINRKKGFLYLKEPKNREKIMKTILLDWRITAKEGNECTAENLISAMHKSSQRQRDAFHDSLTYLFSITEKKFGRFDSTLNVNAFERSTRTRSRRFSPFKNVM